MVVVLHRHQGNERIAEQRVAHLVEGAERAFEAGVDARGDRIARIVARERRALIPHLQQPGGDEFAAWCQQFLGGARMHVTKQRHCACDRPAVVGCGVGEVLHLLEPARAGEKPEQPPGRIGQSQRFDEALGVGRKRFGTRRLGGGPLESVEHVLFVARPCPLEFRRRVGHVAAERFHQRRRQRQGQHIGALVEPDQQAADGPLRQIRPAQQAHEVARHQATLDIGNHGHAWFAADFSKEVICVDRSAMVAATKPKDWADPSHLMEKCGSIWRQDYQPGPPDRPKCTIRLALVRCNSHETGRCGAVLQQPRGDFGPTAIPSKP
jgi:hypothetical protein